MSVSYISPLPLGRLAGATPFAADALYGASEEIAAPRNAAGVREFDLGKVVCMPGGRVGAQLKGEDLFLFGQCLSEGMKPQATAGKPNLMRVMQDAMQAATVAGGSDDAILRKTQRAMVDAAAKYLFKCPDHGGVTHTSDLVIFPAACSGAAEEEEEGDADGWETPVAPQAGSVVGVGTKRAREDDVVSVDSLVSALMADATGPQRTTAAAPAAPAKKKSLATRVSIEAQVGTMI